MDGIRNRRNILGRMGKATFLTHVIVCSWGTHRHWLRHCILPHPWSELESFHIATQTSTQPSLTFIISMSDQKQSKLRPSGMPQTTPCKANQSSKFHSFIVTWIKSRIIFLLIAHWTNRKIASHSCVTSTASSCQVVIQRLARPLRLQDFQCPWPISTFFAGTDHSLSFRHIFRWKIGLPRMKQYKSLLWLRVPWVAIHFLNAMTCCAILAAFNHFESS